MATIDVSNGVGAGLHRANSATRTPYLVQVEFDWADVVTANGDTDVAAADVIEVIDVPAGSVILAAGIYKNEAPSGTVSAATFDLGVTGGDVDNFVDGFDYEAADVGAYSAQPAAFAPVVVGASADTLDILVATLTGTLTAGKVTVWALLQDLKPNRGNPGLTALKS